MANRNYEDIRGSDDKRVIFDVDVGRKGALSIVYFDDVQDFSGSEVGNEEVRDAIASPAMMGRNTLAS